MRTAIVIPARYASSRLPGKPLLRTGKYLIQHVYERACQARRADAVIVATDDPRIVAAVESFGGKCAMTRRAHPSGTDRVAEVAATLDADVVVNLQGDEPLIDPAAIDLLPDLLEKDPEAVMATLAAPITSEDTYRDPNCVKLVRDGRGRALYFSRSPIPFVRDGQPDFTGRPARFLQHLGLYAYRREFLSAAGRPTARGPRRIGETRAMRVLGRAGQFRSAWWPTRSAAWIPSDDDASGSVAAHSPERPSRPRA